MGSQLEKVCADPALVAVRGQKSLDVLIQRKGVQRPWGERTVPEERARSRADTP